jgi:hypothetical protein
VLERHFLGGDKVKGVESGSFSSPTNRFVAVRNELAARAKAAGHENIAIRLRSMKQPPMVFRLADKLVPCLASAGRGRNGGSRA